MIDRAGKASGRNHFGIANNECPTFNEEGNSLGVSMDRWRKINTVICFLIVLISISTILICILKTVQHEKNLDTLWKHLDDNYPDVMNSEIGDDVVILFLKGMWVSTNILRSILTLSLVLIIVLCIASLLIRYKCSKKLGTEGAAG